MKKNNSKYLLIGIIAMVILWLLSWLAIEIFFSDREKKGQFGDMFGAINSLFSGLALCGVVYTIFLQYESNKSSEYQFRFNHLLDTVNKQISIFNERIIEFSFECSPYNDGNTLKFSQAIEYYKSIKNSDGLVENFIELNNSNITAVIGFIFHSNKFVYNLIEAESISSIDKEKLKQLYERGLNRNTIDFLSLNSQSIEYKTAKKGLKKVDESVLTVIISMTTSILTNNYS